MKNWSHLLPADKPLKYWRRLCRENGVPWHMFYRRLAVYHWKPEIAISKPQDVHFIPVTRRVRKKFHFWRKIGDEWVRCYEWHIFDRTEIEPQICKKKKD